MNEHQARAIRYGILQSMLRIRKQLMRPGEWNDPAVLPLATIEREIISTGYTLKSDHHLIDLAKHEHSLRWTMRRAEATRRQEAER